jgi:Tol biopolymer transport system component
MAFQRFLTGGLLILAVASPASAQYFGQNKVQYERFNFQVLRTPNFDIYHYPEERAAVERAAKLAEQWRIVLSQRLGHELTGRQPLVLYASQPHFAQTQVIEGLIGEGTGGVTEFFKRRVVMPFASSLGETSHVLGHEMVHAFQYDIGGEGALGLPLWFVEGMAEYLSLGPNDAHTAMWMRALALEEELPGFEDLNDPNYFPYRYGHAAWAYLAGRFGDGIVARAYVEAVRARDPLAGIEAATGIEIEVLSEQWRASLRERHGPRGARSEPAGRRVVSGDSPRRGRLNVSPAISPDGKWLVYLSERSQFSLDLYLTEVATGRVVRSLTTTATDPHLESLQFVASAGAWDRGSRHFAFATIRKGQPVITIVDVTGNSGDREIQVTAVDEAWHPAWSPDGASIAFAGLEGGLSDLYVLDVKSAAVTRLTNDAFAELQPAWSPDGSRIAFVTDRFSSNLDELRFGDVRLGLLTVQTKAIEQLPAFDSGKHINPQWSADAASLILVAEPDGVPNVYRLNLATRQFTRLTAVTTGVSGITALSPALSYAPETDQFAYGVFVDGGYDIRVAPASTAASAEPARSGASTLFGNPSAELSERVMARAASQATSVQNAPIDPYRPKLGLDFIGGATGVGGVSSGRGAFAAGGVGFQFSDILGHHNLGIVAQVNGGVRDFGGQVSYLNRKSRWNWGGVAMLSPYVTGSFGQSLATFNNTLVIVEEELTYRQTDLQLAGITMYPFSRAFRFEVQGGARRIWFDRELTTRFYRYDTGDFLTEDRQEFDAPESLNLGEASAALVYDQSLNGPVGPIMGQRFRFEAGQTAGSLGFTTLQFDFRRYFSPVKPVTFAIRALHVGRYGTDAEDSRLSQLFLGYPSLVRGYDVNTFDAQECGSGFLEGTCPAFDRLLGSRLLVGNAELRFPLFGLFSGEYRYGPIPMEGFLFADAGLAWRSGANPDFGKRESYVTSVGAGLRVNVLGFAVAELAGVRALDRQSRRWRFAFNLLPSF